MNKKDAAPAVIATISKWDDNDYSVEALEPDETTSHTICELAEPHCTYSVRGSSKSILEELRSILGVSATSRVSPSRQLAEIFIDAAEENGIGVVNYPPLRLTP